MSMYQNGSSQSRSLTRSRGHTSRSGWDNPEAQHLDAICQYKTRQENGRESQIASRPVKSQTRSLSIGSEMKPSSVGDQSVMLLSQGGLHDSLGSFNPYSSSSWTGVDNILSYKKYQNDLYSSPLTQPQLRMKNRYVQSLKRDLANQVQQKIGIQCMQGAMKAKARFQQESLQRQQRGKLALIKLADYKSKSCPKHRASCGTHSLSQLRPNSRCLSPIKTDLDERTKTLLSQQTQESRHWRDVSSVSLTSVQRQRQSKSESLSFLTPQKGPRQCGRIQTEPPSRLVADFHAVNLIEDQFRRKGVKYQVDSLRKGLVTLIEASPLKSFPSKRLLSNPIARKWGV